MNIPNILKIMNSMIQIKIDFQAWVFPARVLFEKRAAHSQCTFITNCAKKMQDMTDGFTQKCPIISNLRKLQS